ncbi:hypothetical protein [uncultured Aquimarina sp.]|uniref:hypothetical protein n=1 Tax=uncultured Aquimarina sp. TaxID=575652 RepID=UPI0026081A95|nr:hypothetical protein [uncultured Aquimarina sp.]
MISQTKIAFLWLIPLIFIFNGIVSQRQSEFNEIKHTVLIKHPGEKYAVKTTLTEVQNEEGLPIEYYMDVKSVICLAEVCKVIPVTLYWNNIGGYQNYRLQKGTTLEKYEADLFEPNDYKKLHSILENQNSPFKDIFIEDIWTVPSTIGDQGIDAVSGATILQLDDKDTVPGAALTCYTLWHWANGNIVSVIKKKTGESTSIEQLKMFISNKNEVYFDIALSVLKEKNNYYKPFVEAIIQRAANEDNLLRETFDYLENATPDIYLQAILDLFLQGAKKQKLAAVRSLNNSEVNISKTYLDSLSKELNRLKSFQEVTALLELMQNKNPNSSVVNQNVVPLLDSNFLIARRAYWFLTNQKLDNSQKERISNFYKIHKQKL